MKVTMVMDILKENKPTPIKNKSLKHAIKYLHLPEEFLWQLAGSEI